MSDGYTIDYMSFSKYGLDSHIRWYYENLNGDTVYIINSDLPPHEIDVCLQEISRILQLEQG